MYSMSDYPNFNTLGAVPLLSNMLHFLSLIHTVTAVLPDHPLFFHYFHITLPIFLTGDLFLCSSVHIAQKCGLCGLSLQHYFVIILLKIIAVHFGLTNLALLWPFPKLWLFCTPEEIIMKLVLRVKGLFAFRNELKNDQSQPIRV